MKTLVPVAAFTALTSLMPQDGVDFRSAASLEGLFQAIVNRIEYLKSYSGAVSVKDYGATGDGVADDTAEIQAAMNAAEGRPLVFEPGLTYKVTSTLTMSDGTHINLQGATLKFVVAGNTQDLLPGNNCVVENGTIENAGTVPSGSGESQAPISIGNFQTGAGKSNVTIRDLSIITNRPTGVCLNVFGGSHDVLLENLNFPASAYADTAIQLHWGGQASTDTIEHPHNVTIRNITVGAMAASTTGAIYLSSAYNVLVESCVITSPYRGVVVTPGDFGDDYSVAAQKGKIGNGINVRGVIVTGARYAGIAISGYTQYGLTDHASPTCDTTNGSAVLANVSDTTRLHVGRTIKVGALGTYQIQGISGTSVTVDRAFGATSVGVTITEGSWDHPVRVSGSLFDCDGSATNIAACDVGSIRGARFDDCSFSGSYVDGVKTTGDWTHDCVWDTCQIFDNRNCGFVENRSGKANRNKLINCAIYRCNTAGNTDRTTGSGVYMTSDGGVVENCLIGQAANEKLFYGLSANTTATNTRWVNNRILGLDTALAGYAAFKNGHGVSTTYTMRTLAVGNEVASGLTYFAASGTPMLTQVNNNRVGGVTNVEYQDTAAPASGTWVVGDRVVNATPAAGAASGWVCVAAGTPGTWKEYAPISL